MGDSFKWASQHPLLSISKYESFSTENDSVHGYFKLLAAHSHRCLPVSVDTYIQ